MPCEDGSRGWNYVLTNQRTFELAKNNDHHQHSENILYKQTFLHIIL
jgi:hypothetical protein